jgi:hypothetical protein
MVKKALLGRGASRRKASSQPATRFAQPDMGTIPQTELHRHPKTHFCSRAVVRLPRSLDTGFPRSIGRRRAFT